MRLLGWWLLRQLPRNILRPWYMSEFPGLEYCWPATTEAVMWVRSISISFRKSKTPFEKSSAINFWNQRFAENQNVTLKQKSIFLFNQRQNIKIKENNTRIKASEFYKWYSSNTVDIKLGTRRYLYIKWKYCKSLISLWKGSLFAERVKKSRGKGRERGKACRQTFGTAPPRHPLCIRFWCKLLLARTLTVDRFDLHRLFGRYDVACDLYKRL